MVLALRQSAAVLFFVSAFPVFGWAQYAEQQQQPQQYDPPSRVLRLNYLNGNVSMEPSGIDQWAPAVINRPFSTDDYLYTDARAVAELHTDIAAIRLGEYTNTGVLNLTDSTVQLKMTQGDMYFRLHDLQPNEVFEVDTPNAAINFLRAGIYRIRVDPSANTTFVVARDGQAEITGGGQALTLNPGDAVNLAGSDALAYSVQAAPAPDAFDNWCAGRDARFESAEATRYIPPTVIGYEDMQGHGVWDETPDYGAVWVPNGTPVGWAPYRDGHWAWIEPWGWTWVDDASWGFAPFHYGRWVYWHDHWGWAPGPLGEGRDHRSPIVRPIYAPAMVAWFGGARWGASLAIGGAPSVGWVPLGWGEVYTPCYHVSPHYFNNVNVYNTRVVNNVNITNVYRTVYVNKTVYNQTFVNVHAPNGVMAMRQDQFAGGRPVHEGVISIRQDQLAHFPSTQSAITAPPVAPSRQAVLTTLGRPAARPQQEAFARPVVTRATPPAPMAAFAARQSFLQQHAGQTHDFAQMHQAVNAAPARATGFIRPAPVAQSVVVQPGQHVGAVTQNNPSTRDLRSSSPTRELQGSAVPNSGRPAPPNQHANGRPANGTYQQNQAQPNHVQQNQMQPQVRHGLPPNAPAPSTPPRDNARRVDPQPASAQQRAEPPRPEQPRVEQPRVEQRPEQHVEHQSPPPQSHGEPPAHNTAAPAPHVEPQHNEQQHAQQHEEQKHEASKDDKKPK